MDAPTQLGAAAVDALTGTPGGTRSDRTDDRAALDAVRSGDVDAYGAIYSRHVAAVRRLARRMAADRHEADDIVSDVFANTLRAIRHGRGPTDDAEAYLLRSVRHTAGKLRSRKDTGRSEPVTVDRLDRAVDHDVHLRSDVEIALTQLPDRHRDVLWATCVEGRPASEVADGLDAGGVASLALRARRALGRSYLVQRTARPEPTPRCHRTRLSMPGCLRDEVSTSTADAVYRHIDECESCREVYDEMGRLSESMCSVTLVGLLVAVIRGWFRFGAAAATAVAKPLASIAVAGAMVTSTLAIEQPVHDADPTGIDATEDATGPDRPTAPDMTIRSIRPDDPSSRSASASRNDPTPERAGPVAPDTLAGPTFELPVSDTPFGDDFLDPRELATGAGATTPHAPRPPIIDTPDTTSLDDVIDEVADGVVDGVVDGVDDATDLTDDLLTGVTDSLTTTVGGVTGIADGLLGGTVLGDATTAVGETIEHVVADTTDIVDTVAGTATDTIAELTDEVGTVIEPVDTLAGDVLTTVDDIVDPGPPTTPSGDPADLGATLDDVDGLVDDVVDDALDDTVEIALGPLGGLGLFGD